MGELLEWSIFLGAIFFLWYVGKQNEQAQLAKQNQNLLGQTDQTDTNVVSYKQMLANWQPLDYEKGNINDLKQKLQIAVRAAGGDVKIEALKSPASASIPTNQESVTSVTSTSPPLGINSYSNKEKWKVVRGLDRRIIGYELIRNADITST